MSFRDFEFILASTEKDDELTLELDLYNVRAYSLQEAISEAYVRAHNLRTKNGKTWKIVSATDTTHFDNIKKF
tara:strand:+ start:5960 stop:6178 length:219 start_codon:yes stop_codon:yes gene_type:complete